jgi:hypothetical protein
MASSGCLSSQAVASSRLPVPGTPRRDAGTVTPRRDALVAALNTPTRTVSSAGGGHRSAASAAVAAPNRAVLLSALARCLAGRRHLWLARVLAAWRLSLSHILRHQALLRLQTQSQSQQQQLAALRRSLPSAAPPRPGHPSGAGGVLTPAQQATQQGSALLRDALLARLVRSFQLVSLCSALGRWRLALHGLSAPNGAPRGGGPGGISIVAPRALKRASAQEAAIASLRDRLQKAEGAASERAKLLALAQRQLAAQTERRKVAEMGGKQNKEALSRMQIETGRERARDAELGGLREAEAEWLDEAARLVAERQVNRLTDRSPQPSSSLLRCAHLPLHHPLVPPSCARLIVPARISPWLGTLRRAAF